MTQIEQEKLLTLLGIVGPYPSTTLLHFANDDIQSCKTIHRYCQSKGYGYQINVTDEMFYHSLLEHFKEEAETKVVSFDIARPRYLIQGKKYEFVFVTAPIEPKQRSSFLEKTYEIIRNSGNILLFIPKEEYAQKEEWVALLESCYFVATNIIDDLFDSVDVIVSKKMHGWGSR